ncbi:neurochondrin-like [Mercenaria mercenaria]|uniref:neurochondrin-like n=1 Tax=Mercenaria mercenaria TaxID=6596 RepID=UPI00234F7066|nr:neurochondrin-like [Mercenaria mercenaria]
MVCKRQQIQKVKTYPFPVHRKVRKGMETEEKHDVSQYLTVLRRAKSDNEKFAALLMVAKTTKDKSCDVSIKREILDAVGGKFFSRLLKTNKVPDDCPPNIYKNVAMSVLSALCTEPEVANSPVLTENVTSFNNIVLLNPGEEEDKQLVDDTYDCFNSLCQSELGLEFLLKAKSVSTFCQAVISQSYGFEKAHELICCVVSCFGPDTWNGCEQAYHSYVNFLGRQFLEDETLHKFEMCKTLVFLLSAAPNDKEETVEPPWIRPIVRGLDNILRSKIGPTQREPALKLASMMVQVCGIYSIQPPYTYDFKLFLLTTHLCCVEVRMVLEDQDLTLASDKGRLLSSCYTFLENVINHLTSGATIDIDDRQVMQLHCAMVGAFGAVIHFLKRVSIDTNVQWNSIILATVRVLGAWMAEETSALREEIYELIPFLIQISKMCIPPDKIRNKAIESSITQGENSEIDTENKTALESESKSNKDLDSNENIKDSVEQMVVDSSEDLNKKMNGVTVSDTVTDKDNGSIDKVECNGENVALSKGSKDEETALEQSDSQGGKEEDKKTDNEKDHENSGTENVENDKDSVEEVNSVENAKRISDSRLEKEVLNVAELQELHEKADILHFLLPALCHLTAEEEPRHVLLNCGGLGVLDLYMWRQWERLVEQENLRETLSSLVILCNIFLNLIIVEPALVPENQEFCHILLLVCKGIHVVELDPDYIVLWSHMITLGLMLIRALHSNIDEFLEKDSVDRFFVSSIRFLSGAYTAKHKKRQATLDIIDTYKMAWEQISQTWFLSMQAFAYCVSAYPDLPGIVLKTAWLPGLLKTLTDVKANSVAEETRSCFLLLLTAVAKVNKSAKSVIREKGGLDLARSFKSPELQEILQAS